MSDDGYREEFMAHMKALKAEEAAGWQALVDAPGTWEEKARRLHASCFEQSKRLQVYERDAARRAWAHFLGGER
jgi:hypothetical protein